MTNKKLDQYANCGILDVVSNTVYFDKNNLPKSSVLKENKINIRYKYSRNNF